MADMRYAILADIHANAAALMAVLWDVDCRGGADELWCLGDIVGYGPDPHRCVELLRQFKCAGVSGNNDLAALKQARLARFEAGTTNALHWMVGQLTSEDILFLAALQPVVVKDDFTLVHGSPRCPSREYVSSLRIACENFSCFTTPYCLVGHTHISAAYKNEGATVSTVPFPENGGLALGDFPMIINPGSVGQPRDNDPRASYIIYDSHAGTLSLHRVLYDNVSMRDHMWGWGQPMRLDSRLEHGA
jgi:predicted phosphodiesterase